MTAQPFTATPAASSTSVATADLSEWGRRQHSGAGFLLRSLSTGSTRCSVVLEASLQQLQRYTLKSQDGGVIHSTRGTPASLVTERPCTRTTHRCMLIGVPLSDRLAVRGGLRVSRGHQSMCPQGGARVNDSHFRHYWDMCHLFLLSSPRRAHGVTRTERDPSASPARATPWHRERPRGLCNRVESVHDVCLVWCTARRSPQHRCLQSLNGFFAGGRGGRTIPRPTPPATSHRRPARPTPTHRSLDRRNGADGDLLRRRCGGTPTYGGQG
jgi:hypothetical protein